MSTRLFVSLLAAALMLPQAALSNSAASDDFRLPPIPYAQTIPWLTGTAPAAAPPSYLGLLLMPQLTPQFAAVPVPSSALFSERLTIGDGVDKSMRTTALEK